MDYTDYTGYADYTNYTWFLSTFVLKDHSKWKANKNEHGDGDNAHPNVHSKSDKNEKKNFNQKLILIKNFNHEIHHCWKNRVSDHSNGQKNEIVDSSELTAAKFLIYLFL